MDELSKFQNMEFLKDEPDLQVRHISQYQAEKTEVLKLVFKDRYEEAFTLCCKLYEKELEFFGPEDPELLDTKGKLASLLQKVNRKDDSLKLQAELVTTFEKKNGPADKRTLSVKSTYAKLLREMGQVEKALEIYLQLFSSEKNFKNRGTENVSTLTSLAEIYENDMKDLEEAVKYLQLKYDLLVGAKNFGKDHDDTVNTHIKIQILKKSMGLE